VCPLTDWLSKGELQGISLVLISNISNEILEKWDFEIQTVPADGDTTVTGRKKEYGKKELAEIQKGIRNVMRQSERVYLHFEHCPLSLSLSNCGIAFFIFDFCSYGDSNFSAIAGSSLCV